MHATMYLEIFSAIKKRLHPLSIFFSEAYHAHEWEIAPNLTPQRLIYLETTSESEHIYLLPQLAIFSTSQNKLADISH